MDEQSGESEDEVTGEGIGESEMEELVPWCMVRSQLNSPHGTKNRKKYIMKRTKKSI